MDCSAKPVVVALRVRPFSAEESKNNEVKTVVEEVPNGSELHINGISLSIFDHIFDESSEQSTVYEEIIKPRLEYLYQGYNSAILAYGQTGTGKTYTIGMEPKYTNEESQGGILERVMKDVLSTSFKNEASVRISFMEIYNEDAYDLLGQNSSKLVVRDFTVQNLTCLEVTQYEEVKQYLISGASNRHTRSTKMNACSSRSHAIFTVYYRQSKGNSDLESRINLVDLAGSEGARNTGNKGEALAEGSNINKGVLNLGCVISDLSGKSSKFVSYRSSLLTTVLKDSLNLKSYITIIICISPSSRDLIQTKNTLRFAEQAKNMKVQPNLSIRTERYKTSNPEGVEQTPSTKLKRGKPKPGGVANQRRPFGAYNWMQSTPGMPGVFKKPNLNFSAENTSTLQLNSSVASSFMDSIDLSPVVKRHVEKFREAWMNEIPNIIRSELEKTLQNNEAMKENFSTLKNARLMSLREDLSDLTGTVFHNNIRRSVRLSQKYFAHTLSTVHPDKTASIITKEVNNIEVPNFIKRANIINTPKSSERVLQTSVRRSARLVSSLAVSSTPQSDPRKTSANTTEINTSPNIVSPPHLSRRSTPRDNSNEKNEFFERKQKTPPSDSEEVSILSPRKSIRIRVLKERQLNTTKERAYYPKKSPQISRKKPQSSLHAVSNKSRKIGKRNCTCISSKDLISYALDLSPVSKVKKHILDLLNGTIRDLVKLPTIGPKTGFIIYNYRLVRDSPFTKIEDLKEVPGLPSSFYQQFVLANCSAFTKVDEEPRI